MKSIGKSAMKHQVKVKISSIKLQLKQRMISNITIILE